MGRSRHPPHSPMRLSDIRAAHDLIRPHIHRTPVLTSRSLDERFGARLFFKAENLQKIGAFKARGATHAVLRLPESAARDGVVTHSSGNHAAALALAANLRGIPAYIVMPENAPSVKIDSVRRLGGKITFCSPTLPAREAAAAALIASTGASLVHPYDNDDIIAGQGTAALELLEEIPDLDLVLCPVGGGGLLGGTAVAVKETRSTIRVFGCEPASADDAARSLASGRIEPSVNPQTIADGLRTSLGSRTFPLLQRYVDGIATVSETAIAEATVLSWEILKTVIEPSSAVVLAALLEERITGPSGRRVGLILSGGNVDFRNLTWLRR